MATRAVTWNMAFWSHRRHHEEAWRWLFSELQPDIALCQECVPPDWVSEERTVLWNPAYPPETGSKQPWGTALVTSLPVKPSRLPELDAWLDEIPKYRLIPWNPSQLRPCWSNP